VNACPECERRRAEADADWYQAELRHREHGTTFGNGPRRDAYNRWRDSISADRAPS
jgi:hypothetical protein